MVTYSINNGSIRGTVGNTDVFYAMINNNSANIKQCSLSGKFDETTVSIHALFPGCTNLISANLTGLDTSNFDSFAGMFENCEKLETVYINDLDLSSVTSTQYMFGGCSSLKRINISKWQISDNLNDVVGMFDGCSNLEKIYVSSNLNTISPRYNLDAFRGCIKLPNYSSDKVNWTSTNTDIQSSSCYFTVYRSDDVITKEFNVSIQTKSNTNIKALVGLVQNDSDANALNVQIVDDLKPLDFSSYTILTVNVQRPDDSDIVLTTGDEVEVIDASQGKLKIVLPQSCVALSGVYNLSISINKGTKRLTTAMITYNVLPDILQDENPTVDSDYPALQGIITQASQVLSYLDNYEQELNDAEDIRVANENERISNETERESNEEERISNEEARETAEGLRETAETTRESNEDDRIAAETTRESNETDRETAETAREEAEEARSVFESYSSTKAYKVGNKVSYEGSSYVCISDTTAGTVPTNTTYWLLIASKGDQGDAFEYSDFTPEQLETLTGPQGPQGETGPQGIQGIQGIQGEKGDTGAAPTITYGSTTTLEPGQSASATFTDLGNDTYQLNLSIPKGADGTNGTNGTNGTDGVDGISPTITTNKVGKTTTVTVVDADGTKTFEILDGADGQGSGDMLTSVYDPTNKAQDIFAYVDNHADKTSIIDINDFDIDDLANGETCFVIKS